MELKWLLFCILIAMDGFVMAAVFGKYREIRRASLWLPVPARIVSSRSEARKVALSARTDGDRIIDTEIRNFAVVTYAFEVGGQHYQGNRISIGHDVGNYQVAEKLARYPKGASITVFYDPASPKDNVIEREMPARGFETTFLIGALVAVVAVFFMLASEDVASRFSQFMPRNGRQSGAVFVAIMGVLAVIFGFGIHRRGLATATWPKTTGRVVSSAVDKVKYHIHRRWYGTLFRGRTIYTYRVAGVDYQSDRTSFGGQAYASLRLFVKDGANRFAPGQQVDVFYDPRAPEQAVLIPGAPGQFLIWAAALALFAMAAWLAGMF